MNGRYYDEMEKESRLELRLFFMQNWFVLFALLCRVEPEADDFDFEEESTPQLRRPGKSPALKGGAKKRTTSLAGILSNMQRHRIMDQKESEDRPTPVATTATAPTPATTTTSNTPNPNPNPPTTSTSNPMTPTTTT